MAEARFPEDFSQRVVVFLPTYNEAGNIRQLIEALLALGPTVSVLVIDDQSPDGTGNIVADMAKANSRIMLISRQPPRGRGLAGRDGFIWFQQHPEYDVLVEMDADFSHHPSAIPELVAGLADADVVIGSRYVPGGGEVGRSNDRKWISSLANAYLRFVLRTRQRDCTSGFRVFSRAALTGLDFTQYVSVGPPIVTELLFDLLRHRRRIIERPIIFTDRVKGVSKLTKRILIDSLWFPLYLRLRRHLHR